MTTDLQAMLSAPDGARQLDQWFCDVLRAGDFAGLDAFLAEELAAHPHPLTDLCRSIGANPMMIIGWDEFFVTYRCCAARNPDRPITAVGLDLSQHCEPEDDDWGLETNFYDDGAFAFSAGDVAAVNAAAAKGSSPWRGDFRELTHALSLRGAGRLYSALETASITDPQAYGAPASVAHAAERLGWLFLNLRFHQAIVRAIADVGMPAPMIVLGGANEVDPYAEAAYWCDQVAEFATPDLQIPAPAPPSKDALRRETDDFIAQWRDRRNVIIRNQLRADKQQDWIDYCTASDAVNRKIYALGDGPPVHLLSDHEFEMLLYRVRLDRALKIGDDPDSVTPPPARRGGFLSLFRRAA